MKEIEVVYEKGVFKPLEDVKLKEGVKGKVRIEEEEEGFEDFERFFGIFKGKEIHIDEEKDEMIRERISDRHENNMMEKYHLLPNDALIAAICKHHGIGKIATFNEDFKRVDFLDVLERINK